MLTRSASEQSDSYLNNLPEDSEHKVFRVLGFALHQVIGTNVCDLAANFSCPINTNVVVPGGGEWCFRIHIEGYIFDCVFDGHIDQLGQ